MNNAFRNSAAQAMTNEAGPDFIGYFKHLTLELLMDSEMFQLPYPEFKEERLKAILNQSVGFLVRETDKINNKIMAKLYMDLDSSNKEKLSCHSPKSDERISDFSRKRKASSIFSKENGNAYTFQNFIGKACKDTQGNTEIVKDLQKAELQAELDKMEQDVEEFISIIFSKCRPMTSAEKERLGRQMKELPEKALNRVVEIVLSNKPSETAPTQVFVDLETQVVFWQLQSDKQRVN